MFASRDRSTTATIDVDIAVMWVSMFRAALVF